MPFAKGQSGNPKGRPPKGRALTDILETALEEKYGADQVALKQVMAQKIARAIAAGVIEFPNGKKARRLRLDADKWFDLVRFIYTHIDGSARAELDVTTHDETITVALIKDDES